MKIYLLASHFNRSGARACGSDPEGFRNRDSDACPANSGSSFSSKEKEQKKKYFLSLSFQKESNQRKL
jgi:hypothetical protein